MVTTPQILEAFELLIYHRGRLDMAPHDPTRRVELGRARQHLEQLLDDWRLTPAPVRPERSADLEAKWAQLVDRSTELANLLQGALFLLEDFLGEEVGTMRPLEPPDARDRAAYRSLVDRCEALGLGPLLDRKSAMAALVDRPLTFAADRSRHSGTSGAEVE
jgi:hypothetical protein